MSSGLFLFVGLLGLDSLALVHPFPEQKGFSFSQRKGCSSRRENEGFPALWIKCKLALVNAQGQRRRLSSWRRLLSYTYVWRQRSFHFSSIYVLRWLTYLTTTFHFSRIIFKCCGDLTYLTTTFHFSNIIFKCCGDLTYLGAIHPTGYGQLFTCWFKFTCNWRMCFFLCFKSPPPCNKPVSHIGIT